MKKKILFSLILTALLVCLFAFSISAATIYKDANGEELFRYETFATADEVTAYFGFAYNDAVGVIKSYSGSFPKTNEDGNALTWYITETATEGSNTVITVASGTTVGDVGNVNDDGVYNLNSGYSKNNIVSANFPDNAGIKKLGFGSYGGYSGSFPKSGTNILFVYCPNTLTEFSIDFIQSTPVIVCELDSETSITQIPKKFAHDARNLRTINIPSSVQTIVGESSSQGAAFYRNVMLQNVTFASDKSLTKLGAYCFSDCISLTSFRVPSSVTEMGGQCFQNCKKLQKIWLGASLQKTLGNSVFRKCDILSVYYVPSTLTSVYQHTFTSDSGTSGPNNTVFFYAGTREQFDVFYQAAVNGKNNQKVTSGYKAEYVIEWDSTKDDSYYINLATSEGHKLYVVNYYSCVAYGDVHGPSQTTYNFKGEAYTTDYCSYSGCPRCNKMVETVICGPLFVNKGYSKELNGTYFDYGFVVNKDEVALYEKATGNTVSYGIIAANKSVSADGKLINDSLSAIEGAILMGFSATAYNLYNVKVTGITEEAYKSQELYCSAYVIENEAVSYIGNEVSDYAILISYNKIEASDE